MGVLGSLGFVPFVMHKFREDREGVARRFGEDRLMVNYARELKLPRQRCIATKDYLLNEFTILQTSSRCS